MSRYGLNFDNDKEGGRMYEECKKVGDYEYTVVPCIRSRPTKAIQVFSKFAGGLNPIFASEHFDRCRERYQTMAKKESRELNTAMFAIWYSIAGEAFIMNKNVNHAEFEKMLYPYYLPTYADACKALDIPKKFYFREEKYATLQNISRLPLDRLDQDGRTKLDFMEWFSLLQGHQFSTMPALFYTSSTSSSFVLTRELVDSLAEYIAMRLETHAKPVSGSRPPVLILGPAHGRLAYFLNQTKKIPVPVISVNQRVNKNPFNVIVPTEKQSLFKPMPIEEMPDEKALEKYEPSMVIRTDMAANKDYFNVIRQQGSVQEYVYLGLPDSPIEGHGWESWGYMLHYDREEGGERLPPHALSGFNKRSLPHISRWMISMYDVDLQQGFGAATTFSKFAIALGWREKLRFGLKRLMHH